MTEPLDDPTWADPRYSRAHAVSDTPPRLGYPPIGDYTRHHVQNELDVGLEQLALSQVWPLAVVADMVDGVLEQVAEDHARHEVTETGRAVVVPLRFWWWREDIPTVDDDVPPTPGVRMLAVALAAPRTKADAR